MVEELLTLGAEVTVIDNFLHGSKIEHLRGHSRLSICEGDVRDAGLVSQALKAKDVIFHLAACVGVEETHMSPLEVLDVEIQGTLNVLNKAVSSGINRFIFASSSEVYGDSSEPMKEEGPFSPKSTYAVAKLVGEEYCKAFYQKHGLEYVILRYFNIYGPRQDERFVIPRFVAKALSHAPFLVYGDGGQTRDFTYIDDAVHMTLLTGIESGARCQAINIGTGVMVTINELADLIAQSVDSKTPAELAHIDYGDKRPRTIEVFTRRASTTKAASLLRYEPETTLPSGIEKYINWYLGG